MGVNYLVGEKLVARIYYHQTGAIEWETHYDEQGRLHGLEREQFEDGRKKYRARWTHGVQHGLQQQWDEAGRLLVATRFVRGTGIDLWFDCGRLSESREFVDGHRHGVERWWRSKHEVWHEIQLWRGQQHGVERQWNESGRLRRGYPKYFVHDQQVTRREYEKAQRRDSTLPALSPSENRPRRKPPQEPAR